MLSSEKISSMAICRKCLEHAVVFPVDLFWSNVHLMFPPMPFSWNTCVWSFFSSILGIEIFSLEGFKVFCIVLMNDKSSHIKKIEKLDGKNRVSLMYCFNCFTNQLWQHLISYNSFRSMNMCLLELAICEKLQKQPFSVGWRRVKSWRIGGLPIWGGYFCWEGSVPHYVPWLLVDYDIWLRCN